MPLTAANAVQAKTGSISDPVAAVTLDSGTQAGSTVTIEINAAGVPITDGGLGGRVPDGFELDGISIAGGSRLCYIFRKRNVTAGEGAAGGSPASWDFTFQPTTSWYWRATEWDTGLEPVFPLEGPIVSDSALGTSPTSLSTGTTQQTSRADVVCLAWHHWHRGTATASAMTWSGHTNGFTVRDSIRATLGGFETGASWSWLFSAVTGQFETTATINLSPRDAGDFFVATMVVYAATTYA